MKSKITPIHDDYPHRNSLLALTLESEIKRVAETRSESINETITQLSRITHLSVRQIYNYRMGKTAIPENQILVFCKQFASTAIVSAWLAENSIVEVPDNFDLVRMATESARNFLQTHDAYLEAFDDGKIDGFEIAELKKKKAKSIASLNRLDQVAEMHYQQGKVA